MCCHAGSGRARGNESERMIRVTVTLCAVLTLPLGVTHALAQAPMPRDSLRQLVEHGDARAAVIVKRYPDSARTTFTHLLPLRAPRSPDSAVPPFTLLRRLAAAAGGQEVRASHLAAARRLALVYATAWRDS